jgi:hypothetical protein
VVVTLAELLLVSLSCSLPLTVAVLTNVPLADGATATTMVMVGGLSGRHGAQIHGDRAVAVRGGTLSWDGRDELDS